jgi:acyl-CoA thioesterase
MEKKTLAAIREQVNKEPMAQRMGLVLEEVSPGQSQVRLQTDNGFTNILGGIHGTAIFALIDEAFQVASNSHGSVAVALNMNLTFHNAPEIGETLTAKAKEVHAGRRTATYLISVTTGSGRLIATCQALAYRKRDRLPFLEGA